jgi:hypothetical protein
MGKVSLSSLNGLSGDIQRYHDSERLIPPAGPSRVGRFCRAIGRLMDETKQTVGDWTASWYTDYRHIPSGKSDEEFEADGRLALNGAFKTAIGMVPGGAFSIAADTERQAVLIWAAATHTSEPQLKAALENVALLKEGRAAGQLAGAATKLIPVVGQLPLVDKAGRFAGKKAINYASAKLSEAVATSDRDGLADILYQAAKAELSAEDWKDEPDPNFDAYTDPRHALYALVVLNVDRGPLRHDLQTGDLSGRSYVRNALN